jgi:hypothetical protein
MLIDSINVPVSDEAIQRYMQDVLGLSVEIRPWAGVGALPYHLLERFELRELTLLGKSVLVAKQQVHREVGLADLRRALAMIEKTVNRPVLYVTEKLASYERRRLVAQRVPFLVPGNQLYLPDLGVDLREYFRHSARATTDTTLSPATQALLIAHWLRMPWRDEWLPAHDVATLGYTPMTLTRCVRELTTAGVATLSPRGRQRALILDRDPRALWERVKPLLRSPVKRTVWVDPTEAARIGPTLRLAGLSALAELTSIADPLRSIHALGPAQWKAATGSGVRQLPAPADGCDEWQLWQYSPALQRDTRTVDPLSLTLSLHRDADERVQIALEELQARFPW